MRRALVSPRAESLSRFRGENLNRSASMAGAAAGAPGTLPPNWIDGANNGGTVARASVALATQLGRPAVDIRVTGTPASGGNYYVVTEPVMASQVGVVWSQAIVVSLVGGSLTNIAYVYVGFDELDAGNAYLGSSSGASIVPTANPQVIRATWPVANATAAKVYPAFGFVYNAAAAIDLTLRVSQPLFATGPVGY